MIGITDNLLGSVVGVYLARAKDEEILKRKVASGGAVTAMLIYALEKGLIDGVVTAKRVRGFEGQAIVARTREEILEAAGNKWSIVPFAARVRAKIEEEDLKKVAVVCLPCQAQFFGQMREFPILETDFGERIRYIIGLFCTGTFAFEALLNYLRIKYNIKAEDIKNITLKEGFLEIQHDDSLLQLPLKEVYSYLQTGCLVCTDYTGMWSDISAGFIEKEKGWTVLITRNIRGEELVKGAEREGYLEVRDGSHVMGDILRAAREKLARAQKNMMSLL
ncbi:Coenzyme F420 hydrogenase/dehydrogenase, beta subunit C-terminal domain [Pyrococcus kukulkanii]|uniref:Coenzyme F420 hydrogenase n=1 Tax=Pyrococcus kukulkanii TaxID=1609559 RepID=A0A127BBV2_9EURY|nr:Coenzyme F420 hydrogenase/dehydrogenase, beta subunit C-terminal domain [Pyrococcus kukulkanii]AMM54737.1 coenzyme F420 hydrogenase [Pyrococcus kukulkanii]